MVFFVFLFVVGVSLGGVLCFVLCGFFGVFFGGDCCFLCFAFLFFCFLFCFFVCFPLLSNWIIVKIIHNISFVPCSPGCR